MDPKMKRSVIGRQSGLQAKSTLISADKAPPPTKYGSSPAIQAKGPSLAPACQLPPPTKYGSPAAQAKGAIIPGQPHHHPSTKYGQPSTGNEKIRERTPMAGKQAASWTHGHFSAPPRATLQPKKPHHGFAGKVSTIQKAEDWTEAEISDYIKDFTLDNFSDEYKQQIPEKVIGLMVRQLQLKKDEADFLQSIKKIGEMPSFKFAGQDYHVNVRSSETFHITLEAKTKIHFFFKTSSAGLEDAQPKKAERGGSPQTKKKFSDLPDKLQYFINKYWEKLLTF